MYYSEVCSFVLFVLLLLIWFKYYKKTYTYWKERNVYSDERCLPLFGDIRLSYLFKSNLQVLSCLYESLAGKPYGGIYFFTKPAIILRDPDLIKRILVTDFHYFMDRGFHTNDSNDPLSKNLIHVDGTIWKQMRSKLQTPFNINKLKNMIERMDVLAKETVKQIEIGNVKRPTENIGDVEQIFEAINVSERYMIDVLCSTAFGVQSSAVDSDMKSDFYSVGKNIFDGHHFLIHVFVGYFFPDLHKLLNLTVARERVTQFFTAISREFFALRKQMDDFSGNTDRKNFLGTLIDMVEDEKESSVGDDPGDEVTAKNDKIVSSSASGRDRKNQVCDEDFVAANVFMFFAAGYDSSARVCTFCLYELAANQTIQNRVREEIVNVLEAYDNNLTLEAVQKMTYLEQIVAESNRKYPVLSAIFRKCGKRYIMPDGGIIEPGVPVLIPSSAIHFDPEYYPEPDKFDPERFSEENKQNVHPSTHLPFGMGPRMCVAWQFAIVEIKVILARILAAYTISLHRSSREYPLKLRPKAFLLESQSDIYINFTNNY